MAPTGLRIRKAASPDPSAIARKKKRGRRTQSVRLPFFHVLTTLLIGLALIVVLVARFARPGIERCPDCNRKREDDEPICPCGWVFEYPDDGEPLEYGTSEEAEP